MSYIHSTLAPKPIYLSDSLSIHANRGPDLTMKIISLSLSPPVVTFIASMTTSVRSLYHSAQVSRTDGETGVMFSISYPAEPLVGGIFMSGHYALNQDTLVRSDDQGDGKHYSIDKGMQYMSKQSRTHSGSNNERYEFKHISTCPMHAQPEGSSHA